MTDQATTADQASRNATARRTRRQLLAGGTGALAAVLTAEMLARPAPASAANGGNVILGGQNVETATTVISTAADDSASSALHGVGTGEAAGLVGYSDRGAGVSGATNTGWGVSGSTNGLGIGVHGSVAVGGTGVHGNADTGEGVYGQSGTTASSLVPVRNGVHGITDSAEGYGLVGENVAGGTAVIGIGGDFGVIGSSNVGRGVEGVSGGDAAVHGANSGAGNGVHGDAPAGTGVLATGATALKVHGPAVFSRSGTLTIRAGRSSAVKTGVALTSASLVLATLQQDLAGVWIRSAVPDVAASSFTVHLSKAVPAPTKVAWFIVN
jgi:hypothetical protein